MSHRRPAALALAALSVVLLAGCTAGTTGPMPTPSAPSTTPTAEPTAGAEPTTAPSPAPVACDDLLTEAGRAYLDQHGFPHHPDAPPFDPLAAAITEAGGSYCAWGNPNAEFALAIARVEFPAAETAAWTTTFAALGYTPTEGTVYTGPADPSGEASPAASLADGVAVYVDHPDHLAFVALDPA
ncbi:hypothetical protein [Agromyces sp. LHK192]|uniref:hypothetical protein n=1 Tax=Agromyces sp. LHK192 TaxID=2498704 RepID=UPI000FD76E58|nr:hypothetical protein [Agromyces sp. LHK192]